MPANLTLARISNGLPALLLLLLPPSAAFAKDTVPDWVRTAMAQKLSTYSPSTAAVILLEETTLSVNKDGKATQHYRFVGKVLRPSGRDLAHVTVPFDKDSKILSLHVWSVGPDGHEYAVKDSEMMDVGDFNVEPYSDEKFRRALAPAVDVGSFVAFEYEQRYPPYIAECGWDFQGNLPEVHQSFTLELPEGYTYNAAWLHHDKLEPVNQGGQRWHWEIDNVPAIDVEDAPLHPSPHTLAGRMNVTYGPASSPVQVGTWQQIGLWQQNLMRDRLAATPEMVAKVNELTAGKSDFFDRARAVSEFAQQIRYFDIEIRIGGFQPHPAAETFAHRYGDCKDKATLLAAMASAAGIQATLVIVDTTRGMIQPDMVSAFGNHAISAIEIPAGYQSPRMRSVVTAKTGKRYLLFDPTSEKTPFGQIENYLQGGYGILMTGPATEPIAIPVMPPEANTVARSASFHLLPNGQLTGAVVERRFGDSARNWRDLYATADAKQQASRINRVVGEDLSSFTVSDYKVENVAKLGDDLTASYSLVANQYGKAMGSLLMVRPRVLGTDVPLVNRKKRSVPIDLRSTSLEKDDYTIELPSGYAVDELPAPVTMDVGFAAYESSAIVSGTTLHYTRTYTVRQIVLPAERYADLRKLAAIIEADESSTVVLKKTPPAGL